MAQLSGSKRFLLAPPSAWPLVRVFPFLHPSHAQCQRDLDALDGAELAAAGGQSAILSRGDVLYLPPLYFHETLALQADEEDGERSGEGSGARWPISGVVGVNGWVDGAEGAAASDLFALRVPELGLVADPGAPSQSGGSGGTSGRGKPTTKMEDVASAAAALVLTLSEACFGDSALVASRVWAERYRSLAVEGGALRRSPSHATLRIDCATVAARRRSALWAPRLSEWGHKTARVAARFSDETRGVWVANLAERLAAERVGLEWAASFWQALHSCQPAAKDDR